MTKPSASYSPPPPKPKVHLIVVAQTYVFVLLPARQHMHWLQRPADVSLVIRSSTTSSCSMLHVVSCLTFTTCRFFGNNTLHGFQKSQQKHAVMKLGSLIACVKPD